MASPVKHFSVYRIALQKYITDKKGIGTFKFGGRWIPKGYHGIYTSESRSLAFCEFMANNNIKSLPKDLSIIEIHIPIKLKILIIDEKKLSQKWKQSLSKECKAVGEKWILEGHSCILKVPSAVIREEFNYVLNPTHKDFHAIKFLKSKLFLADERIINQFKQG